MDALAQGRTVSGVVTDPEIREGLPGVTILEKGTNSVTVSNVDGSYSMQVSEGATLVYSFVGYATQEIVVGDRNTIDVELKTDIASLEEVVVVGYTTRKRGELTGSVSTIDNEVLQKTPNKDLAKSLSGRVPGLIVADRGGLPGTSDMDILIRGKSTLGNNSPLILIDGIPAASFSFLAPADIESISVLKDGAAAIYGARAANGVILVTTKRGKKGTPQINLSSQLSMAGLTAIPKMMDSYQITTYYNEDAERAGIALPYTQAEIDNYRAGNGTNSDWYGATLSDYTPEWRHTVSVSGGGDNVSYFLSGDILEQEGAFKTGHVNFKQKQLRSNIDINLTKFLKVGVDVSGRFGDRNEPGVTLSHIYKHLYYNLPMEPIRNPNGSLAWGGEDGANPVIMTGPEAGFNNVDDKNIRTRLSFEVDLDQWVEGLNVQGYAGIVDWSTRTKSWYTPWTYYDYNDLTGEYTANTGNSQQGTSQVLRENFWEFNELMLNTTVRYDNTFGDHSIRGFVGIERFESNQSKCLCTETRVSRK